MNGTMAMERTEAQGMAALRADLNCEAGRHRMRAALREVLERLEGSAPAVRMLRFGVHATAVNVLRSRPADGDLAPMDRRYVYDALSALMTDVVRHNLLDPADPVYLTAMDAMAACEEG